MSDNPLPEGAPILRELGSALDENISAVDQSMCLDSLRSYRFLGSEV